MASRIVAAHRPAGSGPGFFPFWLALLGADFVIGLLENAFLKAINSDDMRQKMDATGLALKPMVG